MTINFSSEHLQEKYVWNTDNKLDPQISDQSDDLVLNKEEGLEVLHFIIQYMRNHNLTGIEDGHKIEKMIHYAPEQLKKRHEIAFWIEYWYHDL